MTTDRESVNLAAMVIRFATDEAEVRAFTKADGFPKRIWPDRDVYNWPDVVEWAMARRDDIPTLAAWAEGYDEVLADEWYASAWFRRRYGVARSTWSAWTLRPDFPLSRQMDELDHWGKSEVEEWIEDVGVGLPAYWAGQEGLAPWSLRGMAEALGVSINQPKIWRMHPEFPKPLGGVRGRAHFYNPDEVIEWVQKYSGSGEKGTPKTGIAIPPGVLKERRRRHLRSL